MAGKKGPKTEEHKRNISKAMKGKKRNPFSEEHKRNISKVMKGKSKPEGFGEKLSIAKTGIKRPDMVGDLNTAKREDVRKKISENNVGFTGRHHSIESRKLISKSTKGKSKPEGHSLNVALSKIGELNPAWMGGISYGPYCQVWSDKEYKESILRRDGYRCLNPECSGVSDKLCLHHINYIKKDCGPFNLITVCNSCNGKANFDREWHKSWYQAIIHKRHPGRIIKGDGTNKL